MNNDVKMYRRIGAYLLVGSLIILAALNYWVAMGTLLLGSFTGAYIVYEDND